MGQKLGDLEVLELVATGGMAEVYRARLGEKTFAVKKILPEFTREKELLGMFLEEARVAATLRHPNIVAVYDLAKSDDGDYFIVMEFADGKDVSDVLHAAGTKGLRFTPSAAIHVARETCKALDYAHNAKDKAGRPMNLIHRDVSPHNVMMGFEGWVKLTDFGIAKVAHSGHQTVAGVVKGKFGYMSPEQARGKKLDGRSDLYNVGILLYEMLSGERLFAGSSDLSTIDRMRSGEVPRLAPVSQVPPDLEGVMRKALAKNPDERFSDAGSMVQALDAALAKIPNANGARDVSVLVRRLFGVGILESNKAPERTKIVAISSATSGAPSSSPQPPPGPAPAFGNPKSVVIGGKGVMALDGAKRPTAPAQPAAPKANPAVVQRPPPRQEEDSNATQMVDIAALEKMEAQAQAKRNEDPWAPTPSKENKRPTGQTAVPAALQKKISNPALVARPPVRQEEAENTRFDPQPPAVPASAAVLPKKAPVMDAEDHTRMDANPPPAVLPRRAPVVDNDDTSDNTRMDLAPPGLVESKKAPAPPRAPAPPPAPAKKAPPPPPVAARMPPPPPAAAKQATRKPLAPPPPPPVDDPSTDDLGFKKADDNATEEGFISVAQAPKDAFSSVPDAPGMNQPAPGGHTMMMMADALLAADGLLGDGTASSEMRMPKAPPVDDEEAEKEKKKQEALERLRAKKAAKAAAASGGGDGGEGPALLFDAAEDAPASALSDDEKARKKAEALERIRAKKAAKAAGGGDGDADIAPPPDVPEAPEVVAREEPVTEWKTRPDAPPSAPHPDRAGKVLDKPIETYDRDIRPMARRGAWRIGEPAISPGSLPRRYRRQFFRTAFPPATRRRGTFLAIACAVGGYFLSINYGELIAREVTPYLGKETAIFFPGAVLVNAAGAVEGTTLTVRSSPPGATVSVDGEDLPGLTPMTVQKVLKDGEHKVVVKKDGAEKEATFSSSAEKVAAHVNLTLGTDAVVEVKGSLDGAMVFLDGRPVGAPPVTLNDVGRDRVRHLQVRQGDQVLVDEALLPTRDEHVSVELGDSGSGQVVVQSMPAAWVLADGVATYQTTGAQALQLSPGKHLLTLVAPSTGQARMISVETGKSGKTWVVDFHD